MEHRAATRARAAARAAGSSGSDSGSGSSGSDSGSGSSSGGPSCGDGVIELDEECDGDDLGGFDCASLGLGDGTLTCTAQCYFDLGGCSG
ncbi:MAG: hypothetical protein IPK74_16690 [Deltaproteobacteria bacterium]|nr:hypothetical protein [Deltaproteobacteria bacterium]